jgi:hypothetical protein
MCMFMEKDPNILPTFLLTLPATMKFTSSEKYHHVRKCIFFIRRAYIDTRHPVKTIVFRGTLIVHLMFLE